MNKEALIKDLNEVYNLISDNNISEAMERLEFVISEVKLLNTPNVSCFKTDLTALIAKCKEYYKTHIMGGNLHIVLDDENIDDKSIQACIDAATKENDKLGLEIAKEIQKLTLCQRLDLVTNNYKFYCN